MKNGKQTRRALCAICRAPETVPHLCDRHEAAWIFSIEHSRAVEGRNPAVHFADFVRRVMAEERNGTT